MKSKKILNLLCAFTIIFASAICLSACCKPKATGFDVYIGDTVVSSENNVVTITYGDELDWTELITVKENYSDDTQKVILNDDNGYTITGLPQTINANAEGYNLSVTYGEYDAVQIKLVVNKKTIDMANVDWVYSEAFTYDGEAKTVLLNNLPNGITANYTDNVKTNAGEYTASVTFEYDDVNYELKNNDITNLNWSINKANPTYVLPTDLEANVGDSLSSVELPQGFTWNNPDDLVGDEGERTHFASFTPADTNNYNILENISLTIAVEKLTPTYTQIGAKTATYGDTLNDIILPTETNGTWAWELATTTTVGNVGSNQFVAIFTPNDTDRYKVIRVNVTIEVSPKSVQKPTLTGTYTYTGEEQTAVLNDFDASIMSVTGNKQTNANETGYTITVALLDKANYIWQGSDNTDVAITWVISKATIDMSSVNWNYTEPFTYDGEEKTVILNNLPTSVTANYTDNVKINAGNYTASVTFDYDTSNYNLTNNNVENLSWTINKSSEGIQGTLTIEGWTYGDTPNAPQGLTAVDTIIYVYRASYGGGSYQQVPTNAGTYYVKGIMYGSGNYKYVESNEAMFTIAKRNIAVPNYISENFIYDGEVKSPNVNIDETYLSVTGALERVEEGEYTFEISLKDSINCKWADDSQGAKTYKWYIVSNPFLSISLDTNTLDFDAFNALTKVNVGSTLAFSLGAGYSMFINGSQQNSITLNFGIESCIFEVKQGENTIYSKTIAVNYNFNPIQYVTLGENNYTIEELASIPTVAYGTEIHVVLYEKYVDYFSVSYNDGIIVEDTTIYIYSRFDDSVAFEFEIVCSYPFFDNITLNNQNVTINELLNTKAVSVGSTINISFNSNYTDIVTLYVTTYNGQEEIVTNDFSYTFSDISSSLNICVRDSVYNDTIIDLNIKVATIDIININGTQIDVVEVDYFYEYNLDLNEDEITLSFDQSYLSTYEVYYNTSSSSTKKLTQNTLTLSSDEVGGYLSIHVKDEASEYGSLVAILNVSFVAFNPIEEFVVNYTSEEYDSNLVPYYNNNEYEIRPSGFITSLDIQFTEKYQDCTYKIFDSQNSEVTDFKNAKNDDFTLVVYQNNVKIFECKLDVKYTMYYIDGMTFMGAESISILLTNEPTISQTYQDTNKFTNQSLTLNGQQSLTLNEGENIVNTVYSVTINGELYTLTDTIIANYTSVNITDYIEDITITLPEYYGEVKFSLDFRQSMGSYNLPYLVRVTSDDISIITQSGVSVVSSEIVFNSDYTLCWLEYTLTTGTQNYTFKSYIQTYDSVSNNTNAVLNFSDFDTDENISSQIIDNEITLDVLLSGYINVQLEDSYARAEYYKDGALIDNSYYSFEIDESGVYVIKIIASDNKTTRMITIYATVDPTLTIFDISYNDKNLYLEMSSNGMPSGNVEFDMANGIIRGYFGNKLDSDTTSITITGTSIYEEYLYLSDGTKVTSLTNLTLPLVTDVEGTITGIVGAEYVELVLKNDEMGEYHVYLVVAEAPEIVYPMTFTFDSNNNSQIDDTDYSCLLKLDPNNLMDFGDFSYHSQGVAIYVTRDDLGMGDTDTTVDVTITWSQMYEDLSYQILQEDQTLIAPTVENNKTVTMTLTFVDGICTLIILAEGAVDTSLMTPVLFILDESNDTV